MLSQLCAEIRNYFIRDYHQDIHGGTFVISDGSIELPYLLEGQYFRIVGSVFNDGVHQYGDDDLQDETFLGAVWAMAVPPDVVALSQEIDDWVAANADALNSPYQSESFGGYSYSKSAGRSDSQKGNTSGFGWQDQFASRLAPYRRISVL